MATINRTTTQHQNIKVFKCSSKASSANKRFEDSICKEDVLDVLERFEYKCFYCSDNINPNKWQLDHYNPRANGGLNTFENLVCTCKWCNTMKNALDGVAFINKCNTIVNSNWLKINSVPFEVSDKKHTYVKMKAFKMAKKYLENNLDTTNISDSQLKVIYTAISKAINRNEDAIRAINNRK